MLLFLNRGLPAESGCGICCIGWLTGCTVGDITSPRALGVVLTVGLVLTVGGCGLLYGASSVLEDFFEKKVGRSLLNLICSLPAISIVL